MSLFDDPPPDDPDDPRDQVPIGREHPSTSHNMSDASRVAFASERANVLEYVGLRPEGCTAAECADALRRVRNQIAISFLTLREKGWLERVQYPDASRLAPNEEVDPEGYLTRPTGRRTRGIVHRLRPEVEGQFLRWRQDRARSQNGDE